MKMFPPNPKDWTEDSNHENGNYTCICTDCGSQFVGHKRRVTCKECAMTPQDPTAQDQPVSDPTAETPEIPCPQCGGTGKDAPHTDRWCDACAGTGEANPVDWTLEQLRSEYDKAVASAINRGMAMNQLQRDLDAARAELERVKLELASFQAEWKEDKPLPEDEAIAAFHPLNTGAHETWEEAMRMVGARHSKYGLVGLVHWLLCIRDSMDENALAQLRADLAAAREENKDVRLSLDAAIQERDQYKDGKRTACIERDELKRRLGEGPARIQQAERERDKALEDLAFAEAVNEAHLNIMTIVESCISEANAALLESEGISADGHAKAAEILRDAVSATPKEAKPFGLLMNELLVELDAWWSFDNNQQHTHSYHSKCEFMQKWRDKLSPAIEKAACGKWADQAAAQINDNYNAAVQSGKLPKVP